MASPVVFPEQRKDDTQREESHSVAEWGLTETTRRPDGGWMIAPPPPRGRPKGVRSWAVFIPFNVWWSI